MRWTHPSKDYSCAKLSLARHRLREVILVKRRTTGMTGYLWQGPAYKLRKHSYQRHKVARKSAQLNRSRWPNCTENIETSVCLVSPWWSRWSSKFIENHSSLMETNHCCPPLRIKALLHLPISPNFLIGWSKTLCEIAQGSFQIVSPVTHPRCHHFVYRQSFIGTQGADPACAGCATALPGWRSQRKKVFPLVSNWPKFQVFVVMFHDFTSCPMVF